MSAFHTIQPHLMVQNLLYLYCKFQFYIWINNFLTNRGQSGQVKFHFLNYLSFKCCAGPAGLCSFSPFCIYTYTNGCRSLNTNHKLNKYAQVGHLFAKRVNFRIVQSQDFWICSVVWQKHCPRDQHNENEGLIFIGRKHSPATLIKGESLERFNEFKYLEIEIDN